MTINPYELRKRIELDGAERTVSHLTESLKQGDLKQSVNMFPGAIRVFLRWVPDRYNTARALL